MILNFSINADNTINYENICKKKLLLEQVKNPSHQLTILRFLCRFIFLKFFFFSNPIQQHFQGNKNSIKLFSGNRGNNDGVFFCVVLEFFLSFNSSSFTFYINLRVFFLPSSSSSVIKICLTEIPSISPWETLHLFHFRSFSPTFSGAAFRGVLLLGVHLTGVLRCWTYRFPSFLPG